MVAMSKRDGGAAGGGTWERMLERGGAPLLGRRYGRRRFVGGGLVVAAVGVGLLARPRGAARVWAQAKGGAAGAWQPTGLSEAARELFTGEWRVLRAHARRLVAQRQLQRPRGGRSRCRHRLLRANAWRRWTRRTTRSCTSRAPMACTRRWQTRRPGRRSYGEPAGRYGERRRSERRLRDHPTGLSLLSAVARRRGYLGGVPDRDRR